MRYFRYQDSQIKDMINMDLHKRKMPQIFYDYDVIENVVRNMYTYAILELLYINKHKFEVKNDTMKVTIHSYYKEK